MNNEKKTHVFLKLFGCKSVTFIVQALGLVLWSWLGFSGMHINDAGTFRSLSIIL